MNYFVLVSGVQHSFRLDESGGAPPAKLPWPLWMRISLPDMICLGKKADQSQRRKVFSLSLKWVFIEFSLHRDAYQRKEVWFTDNLSGITGVLLSQGLVDRVMSIGCKTLGNKVLHLFCAWTLNI